MTLRGKKNSGPCQNYNFQVGCVDEIVRRNLDVQGQQSVQQSVYEFLCLNEIDEQEASRTGATHLIHRDLVISRGHGQVRKILDGDEWLNTDTW